jgi:excisionase family DNA binding protein
MQVQLSKDTIQSQRAAWRVNEAAFKLGLSRATIYKMASGGKLRLIKIGGRTLIPDAEIKRLIGSDGI